MRSPINHISLPTYDTVPTYDHISQTLKALGWLPIEEHLLYRDALLTFKCMNNKAHSIYVVPLNNETEFITEILEEMQIWIFQNSDNRAVKDRSNIGGARYGMI